ncbi:MAG: DUF981 family protein [Fervidicoccaceae archaeon]
MALFIDPLTAQLFAMAGAFILIGYAFAKISMLHTTYEEIMKELKPLYIPILLLGIYIAVSGIFCNLLWPLPGSYNILFYDLYPLLGVGLIALAISIKYNYKLEYIGFLALVFGIVTIYYGAVGYANNMTKEPLALFLLYGGAGLSSVLFYFASYQLDRGKVNRGLLILEAALLVLTGLLAAYISANSVPQHLKLFAQWAPIL